MNNQTETPPPSPTAFEPPNRSGRNLLLIAIAFLAVLCCLCALAAGIGLAAYLILTPATIEQSPDFIPFPPIEIPAGVESTPDEPPFPFESTPAEEETLPLEPPTATLLPPAAESIPGLGVSREEMVAYYAGEGAFEFAQPTEMHGIEMVMGEHTRICVDDNCAAVTLGGPPEDLLVVSVVVPTTPENSQQTLTALTLLMDTVAYFAGDETDLPVEILSEVLEAQAARENTERTYENGEYIFFVTYDASTRNAGLAVSHTH